MYKTGKKARRGKHKSSSPGVSPMRKHNTASDMQMDEKYKFIAKKVLNSAFFYINKITFVTRYMYCIEGDIASLSLAFNVLTKA